MGSFEESKNKDSCKNCRFFQEASALSAAGTAQGVCRRYPPTTTGIFVPNPNNPIVHAHEWTAVKKNDWCGEFERAVSITLEGGK